MLHPFHRLPMFGFAFLGFLMLCVILAIACWLAFRSGKEGTTKLSGWAGCLIALALVFVAGLGALGCTAIAFLDAPNELLRRGPVRRIEVHPHESHPDVDKSSRADRVPATPPASPSPEADESEASGLHIQVEMSGGDSTEISRWFREHTDGDVSFSVHPIEGPGGRRTRIDIRIPIPDDEIREIRRQLEKDLPFLHLPEDVRIELKGEDD